MSKDYWNKKLGRPLFQKKYFNSMQAKAYNPQGSKINTSTSAVKK